MQRLGISALGLLMLAALGCGSSDEGDSANGSGANGSLGGRYGGTGALAGRSSAGNSGTGATSNAGATGTGSTAGTTGTGATPGTTGGGSSVGTGGTTTSPSGGSSSTGATSSGGSAATVCQPNDMSTFTPPAYVPARRLGGSCTAAQISDYYTSCFTGGNCAAYLTGGAAQACGTCLAGSDFGSSSYGPLFRYGTSPFLMYETNTGGCIELQGEPACAQKIQAAQLCEQYACAANCPVSDQASYNAMVACKSTARTGTCTTLMAAAVCIMDPAHSTACGGADFQSLFLNMARVFCVEQH
jgi:hypothetical protein